MNKRLVGLVLALVMLTMTSLAFATVPSKTTIDMVRFVRAASATGETLPLSVIVFPVEQVPEASAELASIAGFTKQGAPVVQYFDQSVQDALAPLLPEGFDATSLSLNEFVPIQVNGYDSAYGDVAFFFEFPTGYAEGQPLVALLGIQGDAGVTWFALKAEVVEGLVKIYFTQDVLEKMQTSIVFLTILSGEAADK